MDEKPFLIVDILNFDTRPVAQLKKFTKSAFDVDRILSSANELKYKREIRLLLEGEYSQPSEDFVRHFARPVYSGSLRANVVAEFTEIVKQAFREFLNDTGRQIGYRPLLIRLVATEPATKQAQRLRLMRRL